MEIGITKEETANVSYCWVIEGLATTCDLNFYSDSQIWSVATSFFSQPQYRKRLEWLANFNYAF